jgi:hypothetical protein
MIVAMVSVRMVQVTVGHVVDVIPVLDGLVAAPGTMLVLRIVSRARMIRRASVWILLGHRNGAGFLGRHRATSHLSAELDEPLLASRHRSA